MECAYNRDLAFRSLTPDETLTRLLADASPATIVALGQRNDTTVSVVAKRLGTISLAHPAAG